MNYASFAFGIAIGAAIVGASQAVLSWVRKQEADAKAKGVSEINSLLSKIKPEEAKIVTAIEQKL